MTRSKAAFLAGALLALAVVTVFAWPGGAQAASIERVSVASDESQANSASQDPSISADGRYVAFASMANNLVSGDTNGLPDVFVRDRQAGTTERVSLTSGGVQSIGTGGCFSPAISADGRYVAFVSLASDLVPSEGSGYDVFLRDRVGGTTILVSAADDETPADGDCKRPAVSADGRYVAFESEATNLIGAGVDSNGVMDIYVRDVTGGTTTRVSVSDTEVQAGAGSWLPSISDDGRYVAFQSDASNLVAGDTNGRGDIFVRDVTGGTTTRVSVTDGEAEANEESLVCDVSADGTHVAFESYASNLSTPGGAAGGRDIYVRDLTAGTTTWVSRTRGDTPSNGASVHPSVSSDGRYVSFASSAANLVAGDTNENQDVFVRDVTAGTTTRVNISTSGAETFAGDQDCISDDGAAVAFYSDAPNLVAADTNSTSDIFVAPNAPTIAYSSIRGTHRYQTAQLISQALFPEGLPTGSGVVVAPGETFPEALCGAPLAAAWGGPVLLTPVSGLENGTKAELQRLAPAQVFVIGLSDAVANLIRTALPSATVTVIRGDGGSVYDMSYRVAKALGTKVGDMSGATAVLTVGTNFPDAIGVSPLACAQKWPILLTPGPTTAIPNPPLHAKAAQALTELGIAQVLKVGTYATLPGGVTGVANCSGADRYYTNANVATWARTYTALTFALTAFATGDKFPDALASGPYLAEDGGLLLLSPLSGPVPAPISAVLSASKAEVQHVTYIACIEPVIGQVKALVGGTVNLIFIHHSVGGNWLNNGLTTALNASQYHVADTTYGWTGGSGTDYGSSTDTGDWPGWFNNTVMPLVYAEMDTMTTTNTVAAAPGGNTVIMFKSCYPNSDVGSDITDEKAIYNSLLPYFQAHPDKMFVLITPPPMTVISNPSARHGSCATGWPIATPAGSRTSLPATCSCSTSTTC